jgi:hypothetical protein
MQARNEPEEKRRARFQPATMQARNEPEEKRRA